MVNTLDWQRKVDGVLADLLREEHRLVNQKEYEKVLALQHRRHRIMKRYYRFRTNGVLDA